MTEVRITMNGNKTIYAVRDSSDEVTLDRLMDMLNEALQHTAGRCA